MDSENKNYYDLTDEQSDINLLRIRAAGRFDCSLEHIETEEKYDGFVLARTKKGNRLTVCDVSFQRSSHDGKYHPRLTFRKAFVDYNDVPVSAGSTHIRVPFHSSQDGRTTFWLMVSFLYKFKEIVDLGNFEKTFQAMTSEDFTALLSDSRNYQTIKDTLENQAIDLSEFLQMLPILNIRLLKSLREKLQEFIQNDDVTEKDIQNWIDEDKKKYKRQRCLIFGLEYVDYQREGVISSKKIDILTSIGVNTESHALIELKSPRDDIFYKTPKRTNGRSTSEYKLHPHLARAIPQILEYKNLIEKKDASDPDLVRLGFKKRVRISKCIIIIGKTEKGDDEWRQHRQNLSDALGAGLEILTYTDLFDRLDATIQNLERLPVNEDSPNGGSELEYEEESQDLHTDIPF